MYCRNLVALFMPMTSTPVAMGSKVPACPTRLVLNFFLNCATTSWLVMPEGLSMMTKPSTVVILFRGYVERGMGQFRQWVDGYHEDEQFLHRAFELDPKDPQNFERFLRAHQQRKPVLE